VELAAELTMFLRRHVMKGHLLPTEFDITLVEASPRLIGAMPVEVSHGARERLRSLGIRVHLDSTIKEVRMGGVTLAPRTCKPGETPDQLLCDFTSEGERRMESDLVIWCGGIRGSSSLEPLGFTLDARGKRIEVPASLEVPGLSGVYAIGDSALCMNPATKMPVPWLAQAAMAMGRTVAARIAAEIGSDASTAENAALPVYAFPVFPVVVPLGGKYCAAVAFGRTFMGFSGWCIHELATLRYFITVMPMLRGIAYWWRGARMYAVND
jgi:NADH dehydrogenase